MKTVKIALLAFLMVLLPLAQADNGYVVVVDVALEDTGVAQLDGVRVIPNAALTKNAGGAVEIALIDRSGTELSRIKQPVSFRTLDGGIADGFARVRAYLPYTKTIHAVQVFFNGKKVLEEAIAETLCRRNGVCEQTENVYSCPSDCSTREQDGICTPTKDGVCDPDCARGIDWDCVIKKQEQEQQTRTGTQAEAEEQDTGTAGPETPATGAEQNKKEFPLGIAIGIAMLLLIILILALRMRQRGSAVENILTLVILTGLLLVGMVFIQFKEAQSVEDRFKETQVVFDQHRASNDLDALLKTTEPQSGAQLSELLSNSLYYKTAKLPYGDKNIDVPILIEQTFSAVYGKGNYYLKIETKAKTINLVFVIDGSQSLLDDVDKIKSVIPEIKEVFGKKGYFVRVKIYVLKKETEELTCASTGLNTITPECEDLDETQLYAPFPELERALGKECENSWSIRCYGYPPDENSTSNRGNYYEDWATGTAFVAKEILDGPQNESILNLIFPVSDELSTGSESEQCFDMPINYGNSSPNETKLRDKRRCETCNPTNSDVYNRDFRRQDLTIGNALSVLGYETGVTRPFAVFPILTSPCKIPKEVWGGFTYCTATSENPTAQCCFPEPNNACSTCIVEPPEELTPPEIATWAANWDPADPNTATDTVCLHADKNTMDEIADDMNMLAGERGSILDLSGKLYDSAELQAQLEKIINEEASYTLEAGSLQKERERFSIERSIPLSNGRIASLRFVLYRDREEQENISVDPGTFTTITPIPPVAILSTDAPREGVKNPTDAGDIPPDCLGTGNYVVNFSGIFSYDLNPDDTLSFKWEEASGAGLSGFPITKRDFCYRFPGSETGADTYTIKLTVNDGSINNSTSRDICIGGKCGTVFTLLMIPVEWNSLAGDFVPIAEEHANRFIDNTSLAACKNQVDIKILDAQTQNCNTPFDLTADCLQGAELGQLLQAIRTCADNQGFAGITNDNGRIVGITTGNFAVEINGTCETRVQGFTTGYTTALAVITKDVDLTDSWGPEVTPHELGHTFNACDEYMYSSWSAENNELMTGFRAEGCPNPYPSGPPTNCQNNWCEGTLINPGAKRSFMGPAQVNAPRAFTQETIDEIGSFFSCPT